MLLSILACNMASAMPTLRRCAFALMSVFKKSRLRLFSLEDMNAQNYRVPNQWT